MRQTSGKLRVPHIDLTTVRETLTYIRDDLQRVAGLEAAAAALAKAVDEIEAAERQRAPIQLDIMRSRFLRKPAN
jgi:hypothetical protein